MRTDEGNTGGTDGGKVTNKVKKSTERKTKAHHWNNHKLKSRFARREGKTSVKSPRYLNLSGVFPTKDL